MLDSEAGQPVIMLDPAHNRDIGEGMNPSPATSLCHEAEIQWHAFKRSSWSFGKLLVEIADGQHFRPQYNSLGEWAEARLGIKSASWLSKILTTVRYRLQSAAGDSLEQYPVFCVEEVARFARRGPEQEAQAIEILASGKSQSEIRKAVRALEPEQHEVEEWRHVSLNLPLEVYERWKTACNRARFLLCKRSPTDAECLELMLTEFMLQPMDPRFTRWIALERIDAGEVKCRECGNLNQESLQFHHVLPRSLGGETGPGEILCGQCHEIVTLNEEGNWEKWAIKWGYDPAVLRQLNAKVGQ